jgi:hypothetical protein
MAIGESPSMVSERCSNKRFNATTVVIVAGASSFDKMQEGESVISCARRSYEDILKEEKVIGPLHGGSSERVGADHRLAACSKWLKKQRVDARRHGR